MVLIMQNECAKSYQNCIYLRYSSSCVQKRWAEDHGYESLFYGEQTHIPTSRATPFHGGMELPQYYKEAYDQLVALASTTSVANTLKLGTGIGLVTEHHPISTAKAIATLDRVSNGRFLFGISSHYH